MKGREVVWLILDFFKTHKSMGTYFTYETLLAFKWKGDKKLEEFYNEWLRMVANLQEVVDVAMLT
eukprot:6162908-Alexandrium_andersonii.AAC.1